MAAAPLFIGSEIYRRSRYGGKHPLAIPRVSLVIDLCRALGWLPDERYVDSPVATPAQLARFHDPDYVAAVIACEERQETTPDYRSRFHLGANGNPVFGEIFRRPATACGASLEAVRLLAEGGVVYNPAGGTHHGRRDRASGFCYFNDPVLAILGFLDKGLERVCYLDIDAHHGDGVEDAFATDPRVMTVSVHEAGRWPFTGTTCDPANAVWNLSVPRDLDDGEFACILDEAVLPLVRGFRPEALIVQAGCDALDDDPMSRLALSNGAYRRAILAVRPLAPRLLVLGGGGYNPWAVGRCWSGIWAALNDLDVPERLSGPAEAVLRGVRWSHSRGRTPPEHWFTTLADAPREGPVRDEVRRLVDGVAALAR